MARAVEKKDATFVCNAALPSPFLFIRLCNISLRPFRVIRTEEYTQNIYGHTQHMDQ